jgi:hypothetical protein
LVFEKNAIFSPKISENCDHNIDPCLERPGWLGREAGLFLAAFVTWRARRLALLTWLSVKCGLNKISLHNGAERELERERARARARERARERERERERDSESESESERERKREQNQKVSERRGNKIGRIFAS